MASHPIATSGVTEIKTNQDFLYNFVTIAPDPEGGTQTGGTVTLRAKPVGQKDYEDFTPNSLNIGAPSVITIETPIQELECTVSGFTGTASNVSIGISGK